MPSLSRSLEIAELSSLCAGYALRAHGPPGVHCLSKPSALAQARAIGSRNSPRKATTSESFAGHSVWTLLRNAVHCANVDGCSVKSGPSEQLDLTFEASGAHGDILPSNFYNVKTICPQPFRALPDFAGRDDGSEGLFCAAAAHFEDAICEIEITRPDPCSTLWTVGRPENLETGCPIAHFVEVGS
jgi:hypothetical protein